MEDSYIRNDYISGFKPEVTKELTPIQNFYKDTTIFVTGSTGFLGQLILEKLLRSCPDISTIYILVRHKKGKDMQTRVDEIFESPVFERIKESNPKYRHKVVAIYGDCEQPELGLSPGDRNKLIQEVNLVFHVAATVRFDEKIRKAIHINVRATQDIIMMAREMKNLKCFLHVSTAYSNCVSKTIEEKVYPPAVEYTKMLDLVENFPEDTLDKMVPALLGDYPNTYTFTKQIAEDVVQKLGAGLPISIFRPSVVISTYREPVKGWINNIYGPTGVLTGAGLGLFRILHCDRTVNANIIPADMTVNSLIASAWDVVERRKADNCNNEEIPVYLYENSDKPINWDTFRTLAKANGMKMPSAKSVWYYCFFLQKSFFLYSLFVFFLHTLPALIVDFVLICLGKAPKLVKAYNKIHKFSGVISHFCTQTWDFKSKNVRNLCNKMSPEDQMIFFSDMKQISWEEFFVGYIQGIRIYLTNDPMDTVETAKIRFRRLYWAHQVVKIILLFLGWRLLWFIFSSIYSLF